MSMVRNDELRAEIKWLKEELKRCHQEAFNLQRQLLGLSSGPDQLPTTSGEPRPKPQGGM